MQSLSASQASPEVPINENFSTLSHASIFGKRHPATSALTWGYYGGFWRSILIDDGTVTLSGSATNYVVAELATGIVSVSTSSANWDATSTYVRLYRLVTGSSSVTTEEDHRPGWLWSRPSESLAVTAADVSIADDDGHFTATDVEGALAELAAEVAAASLADGDRGDIVVSGTGATWSIDSSVLSTFGRSLADDADAATARATLGLGTAATQASTAFAAASHTHTSGDITDFTEAAQDVIGAMVAAAGGSYNDGAGTITLPGIADGDKGDITVSSSGAAWAIDNDVVTYAKMQNVSATARVIGRKTAGAGDPEELTLSEVLDLVGSAAQGDILYRGASAWTRLGAGTAGQVLQTQGASANPTWANGGLQCIPIACSDETTALTTGTAKVTFRMPYAFTVTAVRASLTTAQTSGSIFTVDINESGTSIISTKLTIDNTEKTSTTAATAVVISDASLADDAEITVDIDQVGDGTAKGLKVYLIGRPA